MAYDLFKGRTPGKNFAIQGHPPIHSFEYVFSAGGYCKPPAYAPPARRWHPGSKTVGTPLDVSGLQIYEISNTDWEAAVRYMNNLAENVKYTRRVHGDKILSQADMEKWTTLWSRWLLFSWKLYQDIVRQHGPRSLNLPVAIIEATSRTSAVIGSGHVWWTDGKFRGAPVDPRQM